MAGGMSSTVEQADFGPFFARRPGWARLYIHLPGMGQTLADPHVTNFDSLLGALLDALPGWTQGRPFALPDTWRARRVSGTGSRRSGA